MGIDLYLRNMYVSHIYVFRVRSCVSLGCTNGWALRTGGGPAGGWAAGLVGCLAIVFLPQGGKRGISRDEVDSVSQSEPKRSKLQNGVHLREASKRSNDTKKNVTKLSKQKMHV